MVDFNGFDKGVIGKKLPADSTLNCMKKADLIKMLHLAEDNHRVLAEAYSIAVSTSKCNTCPLHIDTRRAEEVRAEAFDEVLSSMHEIYAHNLHCLEDMCEGNEQGYECKDCMYERLSGIVRFLKEQKNE